jgi:hypothetical protein
MNTGTLWTGVQYGWTVFMGFVPKIFMAAVILIVGYFLAKLVARGVDAVLERIGFDRLVERGGIKRALQRTSFDASDIVARIVFYTLVLFVLQLAFSCFGPNPVSTLLSSLIAYLPNIFVAAAIVVIATAIAAGVRQLLEVATGTLSYGRVLANAASATIIIIGVFAALDQLHIAPAIVNGLFYAALAVVVGSTIIAVGGGGIVPMRSVWERALNKAERELPKAKAQMAMAAGNVEEKAEQWKAEAHHELHEEEHVHTETPRF